MNLVEVIVEVIFGVVLLLFLLTLLAAAFDPPIDERDHPPKDRED